MENDDNYQTYYRQDGFSSSKYQSDTIDPSPWALIASLCFCGALILLLPLFVATQQRKRRMKKQSNKQKQVLAVKPSITTALENTVPEPTDLAPTNMEIFSQEVVLPIENNGEDFMENPFCYVEEDSIFNALFDSKDDDERLYGLGTEDDNSSKGDMWEDDPLPTRPTGGFRRAKGMASLLKRAVPKKSTTAMEQGETKDHYVFMRDSAVSTRTGLPIIYDSHADDNLLSYSSSSEGDGVDLLTQLADDFNQLNGMDDYQNKTRANTLGSFPAPTQHNPALWQPPEGVGTCNGTSKYDIDLCCGKRPWYCYFVSRGFLRKLWKCASWDDEMSKIAGLVVPYTLHAAVTHVFGLMEIVVIGQLIAGNNAALLGAYFAVHFVLSLSTMLLNGMINSLTVLCRNAVSARNFELAGKFVQFAVVLYHFGLLPIAAVFWGHMDDMVIWLGFDEEEAAEAKTYGRLAFLAVAVNACHTALHHMLNATGFEWYSSVMDMIHSFARLAGVFVAGWLVDDTPLWMVGAVHLTVAILFGCINLAIVLYNQWLMGFWNGFRGCALRDRNAVRTFLKTAGPLSVGYVVEYCEWDILFVFAAAQGPAEVAVWGLLGHIWEFSENIGEAIADAAEVRVAHLLGSHRPALARYSSHKSLLLGVMTSLFMATVTLGVRNYLPPWLTTDETLQLMLSDLLPLVCVGLAALTFGSMSWTILCAQGRMRLATAIAFLGSACVTLPLAVVSTVVLNFNLQGLLSSIVIGHALSGIVNSFIMITSKWEKISEIASKRG